MKILVIGNGFDLEHGLPTKYKDFLDFIQGIKLLNENITDITEESFCNRLEMKVKHEVDDNVKNYFCNRNLFNISTFDEWREKENGRKLIEYVKNNSWIKFFISNMDYEKEGWIDLESEISEVVKSLDNAYKHLNDIRMQVNDIRGLNAKENNICIKITKILREVFSGIDIDVHSDNFLFDYPESFVTNVFKKDLIKFIQCLEIYLEDCVNKIECKYISPDIRDIQFDKVLSFNYTNTYEKIYASNNDKIEYHYIHGRADLTSEDNDNNMVLGIDEYLNDEIKNKELEFITFKKYFQRVYKKTGNSYTMWIEEIKKDYKEKLNHVRSTYDLNNFEQSIKKIYSSKNEIYIFGHSLDITDKDIIKELIECENTITTIFYYNRDVYAQQITNLVKVIGQDELIKRVSGANPTIIFKKQKQRMERS